jgi:hypothetical protein
MRFSPNPSPSSRPLATPCRKGYDGRRGNTLQMRISGRFSHVFGGCTSTEHHAMRTILLSLALGAISVAGCGNNAKTPNFDQIPKSFGHWEGQNLPITQQIRDSTAAPFLLKRIYWNTQNDAVQIETFLTGFSDWDKGLGHSPLLRNKADGWKLISQKNLSIPTTKDNNISVCLSEWEKDFKNVLVLHWYHCGGRATVDPAEIEKARSESKDPNSLAPLINVRLEIKKTRREGDDEDLKEFAGKIAKWIEND